MTTAEQTPVQLPATGPSSYLDSLPERLGELDTADEIVLHCHHGERSLRALEFLRQAGFRRLRRLRGGIDAWAREVDATVPRY